MGRVTEASGSSPAPPPGSFEAEALPHLDAVYRFAVRLSGSPDQAQDLVQDTFVRAFKAWDQYTPGTQCKSWLFTICRNVYLRQWERGQRHDQIVAERTRPESPGSDEVNPLWSEVDGIDPEADFFKHLVDDEVLRAIEGLPEEFKMPLVLSDVEGLSYQEISDLMDIPVGTVKSRLFRGRRQLQKTLYDYAVEMGHIRGDHGRS